MPFLNVNRSSQTFSSKLKALHSLFVAQTVTFIAGKLHANFNRQFEAGQGNNEQSK